VPAAAADTFSSPVLISSPAQHNAPVLISSPALVLPTPTPSRAPMPPPEDDSDDEFGFGPSPTSRGLGGGFGGGLSGGGLSAGLGGGLSDAPVMVLNSDLDAPQLISERELALSEVSSAVSATLASSEFSEVGSSEWNSPNPLHASAHHDAPPPHRWARRNGTRAHPSDRAPCHPRAGSHPVARPNEALRLTLTTTSLSAERPALGQPTTALSPRCTVTASMRS
jgi:hypothetical protein